MEEDQIIGEGFENEPGVNGSLPENTMAATGLTTPNGQKKNPADESTSLDTDSIHPSADYKSSAKTLFKENIQSTLTYCSVFWSFGICVALLGPTILDLGCKTGTTLEEMKWVFFVQAGFTLLGSFVGGFIVDRFIPDPILLVSVVMIGGTIALIPLAYNIGILIVIFVVMGIFMGIIDTVANVCLIQIYGTLVSPFLQALHFCYGLGAFLSPIIAEPFLLNEDCTPLLGTSSANYSGQPIPLQNSTGPLPSPAQLTTMETLEEAREKTQVQYAFWIMSAIQIPIILLLVALIIRNWFFEKEEHFSRKMKSLYEDIDKGVTSSFSSCAAKFSATMIVITVLASWMLFLSDGLQASYGGWVYTYGFKSHLGLSSTEGAYLTSVFWGTFALGRFVSIPISTALTPAAMLLCNWLGCFSSLAFILGLSHSRIALYAGTGVFGLFLSSMYPSTIALVEQFINITGLITSILVIGAASGEMVLPVVVGKIFVNAAPISFLIACNVTCVLGLLIFVALYLAGYHTAKYKEKMRKGRGAKSTWSSWWCVCCFTSAHAALLTDKVAYYAKMKDTEEDKVSIIPVKQQMPISNGIEVTE